MDKIRDKTRKSGDYDHLGDKPVLPVSPDELDVEEGVVQGEDEDNESLLTDRLTKSGRLQLEQIRNGPETSQERPKRPVTKQGN